MVPPTAFLGKLIGLYSLVMALSMIANKDVALHTVTAVVHDTPVLFIVALMCLVGGLAIVLGHNVWSGGALPVIVTLVGWLTLVKGLVFLFLTPEAAAAYFESLHYDRLFYLYMCVSLVLGGYLTFASFKSAR